MQQLVLQQFPLIVVLRNRRLVDHSRIGRDCLLRRCEIAFEVADDECVVRVSIVLVQLGAFRIIGTARRFNLHARLESRCQSNQSSTSIAIDSNRIVSTIS